MIKIKSLLDLKDNYTTFGSDVWGTIWDGAKIINDMDKILPLLNNPQNSSKVVALSNSNECEKDADLSFEKKGLLKGVHYDRIYTSGELFRSVFLTQYNYKFYFIGEENPNLFEQTKCKLVENITECNYVIIGAPRVDGKPVFTVEPFKSKLKLAKKMGKVAYCINPDLLTPVEGYDVPALQFGALAAYYERLGGKVIYYGKPHYNIFDYAFSGEDKSKILMIGDTLEADIKGGNDYGIDTLFVTSGISMYNMKQAGFKRVEDYIDSVGIYPTYIL